MLMAKPKIFEQFPEIIFGLSKKVNIGEDDKYGFNMSKSIGDSEERVENNRSIFFTKLGLSIESVIIQKQIHSDIINNVDKFQSGLKGDALITNTKNLGLAISTADCTNIYIYDSREKVIAAVHSGWAGTKKKILAKTLNKLAKEFYSKPENIFTYIAPSISQKNYEVGEEFGEKFKSEYMLPKGKKYLLDLKLVNKDMLLNFNIPGAQIEVSDICTYENLDFHSYRRDKDLSGRAFGVIAIRDTNNE